MVDVAKSPPSPRYRCRNSCRGTARCPRRAAPAVVRRDRAPSSPRRRSAWHARRTRPTPRQSRFDAALLSEAARALRDEASDLAWLIQQPGGQRDALTALGVVDAGATIPVAAGMAIPHIRALALVLSYCPVPPKMAAAVAPILDRIMYTSGGYEGVREDGARRSGMDQVIRGWISVRSRERWPREAGDGQ